MRMLATTGVWCQRTRAALIAANRAGIAEMSASSAGDGERIMVSLDPRSATHKAGSRVRHRSARNRRLPVRQLHRDDRRA